METKNFTKSKTMRSLAVCLIVVLMNMFGIGEAEVGQTIDTMHEMHEMQENKTGNIMDIVSLLGLGGAAYGRAVAYKPLGRKKDGAK